MGKTTISALLLIASAGFRCQAQFNIDYSAAQQVIPFAMKTFFPGTCSSGSVLARSDQTPGSNLYYCGTSNDWHLFSGSGGGVNVPAFTGVAKATSSSSTLTAAAYADVVALFASGSCSGYLKNDGTCGSGSSGVSTPTFTGVPKATSSSSTLTAAAYTDVVSLFAAGSCTGYLKNDGTCGSGSSGVSTPTFTGIAKATSSSSTLTAAAYADVIALFAGGSCSSGYLAYNGTCSTPGGSLPSETGNSGLYLTNNGSTASWATVSTGSTLALDCVDNGAGVCDVVTALVPLKTNANVFLGQVTFGQGATATSGTNYSSQATGFQGSYWNGSAAATDTWTWQDVVASGSNPTTTFTLAHSGSSGATTVSIPFNIVIGSGDYYQETLTTPSSSSASCTAGQFTDDANYHYVCTATNTWKRASLSSF